MEEEPPSLLCPECGNIYDLKETFPDCKHLYCATCFLVTNDKTCRVCELHKVDHSECVKHSTMKKSLMELENELEREEDDFIQNQITGIQEKCSKCSNPSEISMICVNCARIKMKRLENEEWIIQEIGEDLKLTDDVFCVECAASGHGGHELVEVAGIQNLADVVKNEFFLEYYHHRKSILRPFVSNIEKYKEVADAHYELVNERNHEEYESTCSTQLIECYKEEMNKMTDSILKFLKLIMRLKRMYIECLQKHINHQIILEETATEESKKSIERLLYRLSSIQLQFEEFIRKYPKVQLTPGDIQEIDAELNARMESLELEYKKKLMIEIELENEPKFHKFQAILKEAEEIKSFNMRDIQEKMSADHEFIEKCYVTIELIRANCNNQQGNPEEAIKFCEMEIMQAEINIDKGIKTGVEINERRFFMELMRLKFFPITPEADAMDAVYNLYF